ncbi:MAG: CBS domain-containing protein [Deltaproteobacteria bacterium]|nr:CBS domain-containing protein [Deltaproteobacteria bacterium]
MKASQIMTREVIVVDPATSLQHAHGLMEAHRIRHLPVTVGLRLVGMISDRDLLREGRWVEDLLVLDSRPVSTIMTPAVITAGISNTISDVAGLMIDHRIDSVPIVALTGDLIGLVTSTDLLELLREDDRGAKIIPFDFTITPGFAASA